MWVMGGIPSRHPSCNSIHRRLIAAVQTPLMDRSVSVRLVMLSLHKHISMSDLLLCLLQGSADVARENISATVAAILASAASVLALTEGMLTN